jgi:hypothetical protein
MRIGTWALDIFLKSNYIEWIARSNRLPGFLTPHAATVGNRGAAISEGSYRSIIGMTGRRAGP